MKHLVKIFTIALILTTLAGCKSNPLDIDISNISAEPVKITRLERDFFAINSQNIEQKTAEIKKNCGPFFDRFIYSTIHLPDSGYQKSILLFVADEDMRSAYTETQKCYGDNSLTAIESELTDCVKRFKYHFPKRKLPLHFVTYMSGFNYNIAYTDSTIGIGLEMYLGDTSRFYKMLQWPAYKVRNMKQDYIVPDVVRGWLLTEFDNADPVNNLLNHMIFYGKIYYACDALLPNTPDSLKIGYTNEQMKYCKEYEKNLWGFFAEKNRLYENSLRTITEFTSEGPFTGAISKECPPRIAMWVGWQIVRNYMDNNKKVTLEELMNEKDAQKILSKSKYRP